VKEYQGSPIAVVITHRDLDGISSGFLLRKYIIESLKQDVKVLFTEPYLLHKTLSKVIKNLNKFKITHLYISDLGLNTNNFDAVLNHLSTVVSKGIKVLWFDHHVWEDEWIDKLKSLGIELVIDRSTCATGIVSGFLKKAGLSFIEDYNWLVRATCSLDLWVFDDPLAPWLSRVATYRNDDLWRYNVMVLLERMSRGEGIKAIEPIVKDYVDKELRLYELYLKKSKAINIGGVRFVFVVKRSDIPNTSYLGHYLLSAANADVAVIIRGVTISFRSREYDVRELAFRLGGGGHKCASGARLKVPLYVSLLTRLGFNSPLINYVAKKIKEVIS